MTSSAATRVWASRSGTLDTTLAYRAGYHPLPWHASSRPVTAHYVRAACACVLGYACMYACVRPAWGRLAARLACGDHLAAELAAKAAKGKRRAQPAPAPAPAPTPAPAPARARAFVTFSLLTTYPPTYCAYSSPGGAPRPLPLDITPLPRLLVSGGGRVSLEPAAPAGYHPSPPPPPPPIWAGAWAATASAFYSCSWSSSCSTAAWASPTGRARARDRVG